MWSRPAWSYVNRIKLDSVISKVFRIPHHSTVSDDWINTTLIKLVVIKRVVIECLIIGESLCTLITVFRGIDNVESFKSYGVQGSMITVVVICSTVQK